MYVCVPACLHLPRGGALGGKERASAPLKQEFQEAENYLIYVVETKPR